MKGWEKAGKMKRIDKFVRENKVDYTPHAPVSEELIEQAQAALKVRFGEQLREYLKKYGYLGFGSIEYNGLNSKQEMGSDLIKETEALHTYFPKSRDTVELGLYGEDGCILVDSDDQVYIHYLDEDEVVPCHMNLEEFILDQFNEEKENIEEEERENTAE